MSQGRTALTAALEDVPGITGVARMLHPLVRQGRSFSGHERNCCYLNTGRERFADISAVSGLDFPDDGRAVAQVDWDLDGDLDLWIGNRSGPQVRYLRNDLASRNHHLSLRLEGRNGNRDGIGARVEVIHTGQPAARSIKTLHAGEGFLAQSSKWLQFGLGEASRIERIVVRWPGGDEEEFTGAVADGRYRIVQGAGRAEPWRHPRRDGKPAPPGQKTESGPPGSSQAAQVFSAAPVPLPRLDYTTFDGQTARLVDGVRPAAPGPVVLLNLWASWCKPCLAELAELDRRSDQLRAAGVQIVALSVDGLDDQAGDPRAAAELVGKLAPRFTCGRATAGLVEKLQIVHNQLFDLHLPLPMPTSVLIDSKGRLAAIYKGLVAVDRVLQDVNHLEAGAEAGRDRSVPFAGRWFAAPARLRLFALAWELVEQGYLDDGIDYLAQNEANISGYPGFAKLLVLVGNGLLARGDGRAAARRYREALRIDSGYVDARNNLAWLLATSADGQIRDGAAAVELAELASKSAGDHGPSLFDTLAAAYAEVGRFEDAAESAKKAIELARSSGQAGLAGRIEKRLRLYQAGQPYRAD